VSASGSFYGTQRAGAGRLTIEIDLDEPPEPKVVELGAHSAVLVWSGVTPRQGG
jgi:hypothetical protein